MKKGYKRLLIFEFFIFIILILNSFVWSILGKYTILLFLLTLLLIFKIFFGLEKDKHRYTKDVILETIIFLLMFFMIYYILGVFIGFARSGNHYTIAGITTFIIPISCLAILEEYLRYVMMCKAEGNKITIATTILLFVFLDITSAIYYGSFDSYYEKFIFVSLTMVPAISKNLCFSYFVLKSGYKPLIVYSLAMNLYYYLIPIVPNPNEYLTSIIQFCVPIIYAYKGFEFFKKTHDEELERDYRKKVAFPLIIAIFIVMVTVYFSSGYFRFWTIAIASGSMEPKIKKGDVVIIEKIGKDFNFGKLKKGDVIAYKHTNVIIVHRLINIIEEDDKYYFYTKGDANNKPDNYSISKDMIVGVVNHKIPLIGIPSVWLSQL